MSPYHSQNAEFQGKAGLQPKIVRRSTFHCCEWCSRLAGTYLYPDVPRDVYRRHANCRCSVEYSEAGTSNMIWQKGDAAQKKAQEKAREERLKNYRSLSEADRKKRDAAALARKRFEERKFTSSGANDKIGKTKYAPSPQRQVKGIQVSPKKYAKLTGVMNTQFPGLTPEDGERTIFDGSFSYRVVADGFGGMVINYKHKQK